MGQQLQKSKNRPHKKSSKNISKLNSPHIEARTRKLKSSTYAAFELS